METLDNKMLNNVRNMTNEQKMDIILAFNDVVEALKNTLK